MRTQRLSLFLCVLGAFGGLAACKDPTHFTPVSKVPVELEDCAASTEWLPNTPDVTMFKPAPHPTTECPFYRGVWQNFLIALQPDATGKPALLGMPTVDSAFQRVTNPHGAAWSYLGDIKQAGERRILVDQNGNTLYYGIHMNQAFADFIQANGLQTAKGIQNYAKVTPKLFFPAGLVEFKSAWQVVEPTDPTADDPTFVTIDTTVPTMHQAADGTITENREEPRPVKVRLLAIHVVYTYPGHPEFIWGSMEHTNVNIAMGQTDTKAADGHRDVAPIVPQDHNPADKDPTNSTVTDSIDHSFILYKGGTPMSNADQFIPENQLHLDEAKQKFLDANQAPQQTSIYRMYPASKSNETSPDDAVTSLNHNVEALFASANLPATDKRPFYRLVGGQWMDKPIHYRIDFPIQNDHTNPYAADPPAASAPDNVPLDIDASKEVPARSVGQDAFDASIIAEGSDSPYSILAGEDRMSSTAMESFTQPQGAFDNCFTCHNTQAINANGVPVPAQSGTVQLVAPGMLNVSHLLSQFVLEECLDGPNPNLQPDPNNPGQMVAVCP